LRDAHCRQAKLPEIWNLAPAFAPLAAWSHPAPKISRISSSHVAKQNDTLHLHCQQLAQLAQLANAGSRNSGHFEAAFAPNFGYCGMIATTPAMAAATETRIGTLDEWAGVCAD
jgi:hypothetical protein